MNWSALRCCAQAKPGSFPLDLKMFSDGKLRLLWHEDRDNSGLCGGRCAGPLRVEQINPSDGAKLGSRILIGTYRPPRQ